MNAAAWLLAGEPARIALIEGEARVDYATLRAGSIRNAAALLDAGLRPGDACVLALPDGIEWATAFIGMLWAGVRPIAINPRTAPPQIADLMLDSGAAAALLEDETVLALGDQRALGRSEWRHRVERASATPAAAPADDDDPAFLLYSSGTTGRPKGIIHAHRAIRDAHVFARDILGARPEHRFYSSSKLFFAYPLANAFFAGLRLGATVVLDTAWPDPQRVAAMVERHEPHIFFSVPTLYRRLVDAGVRFRGLHAAVSAGEACPPALAREWQAMTGVALVNGYGTTETLSLVLYRTPEMDAAHPTPLTTIHPEQLTSGEVETWRLWFSHPAVALGYSRVVTHDSARFADGRFSPGDVFRRAPDGGWQFAGRTDQLVKVFGRWVDVVAIEQALQEHLRGKAEEVCLIPVHGEDADMIRLHLFAIPGDLPKAQVLAATQAAIEALPPYQRPEKVHLVDHFPRTDTGKLRRNELARHAS
ncbi:AMP-binding protein [Thauera phenylacetica]|uniref:AMP-binding protein n=1 Tax=Thauera phenylacetica TaxID=164400 RepID=UPI0039E3F9A9